MKTTKRIYRTVSKRKCRIKSKIKWKTTRKKKENYWWWVLIAWIVEWRNDRDEREVKARDMMKENKELKNKLEEADKYVVLQKIRNWEF